MAQFAEFLERALDLKVRAGKNITMSMITMRGCIGATVSGAPMPVMRIIRSWKRRGSARRRIALGSESACRPKRNGRKPRAVPMGENIPGATSRRTERARISMQAGMIFATVGSFSQGASPYGMS